MDGVGILYPFFLLGRSYFQLAPKNGWLGYILLFFLLGFGIFSGAFAVSFRKAIDW